MSIFRNKKMCVIGIIFVTGFLAVISGWSLSTDILAQAEPTAVEAEAPPLPPPPPPLNPPISTPEPGQTINKIPAQPAIEAEVRRFRPQQQIVLGQPPTFVAKVTPSPAEQANRPQKTAGPQEAYVSPDYGRVLQAQGWNILLYEDFEGVFPGDWARFDTYTDDGKEYWWGDTDYGQQYGYWSGWPALEGADGVDPSNGYPDYVDSWMVSGPYDLSDMSDVFVGFGLWYDTEPEYDWMKFCVSTAWPNFSCEYWSGYSGGWVDMARWLTSYAGYSTVYFAWDFTSDYLIGGDRGYLGPFLDEIYVWGYEGSATPTPTPDPGGQLIQNPSFETGSLSGWQTRATVYKSPGPLQSVPRPFPADDGSAGILSESSAGVVDTTSVEGTWSAYLWQANQGDDFLYQTLAIPGNITDMVLNYWFAVTTYETAIRTDWFCVSLANPANHNDIWIDLGCIDAVDSTGYWQEALYTLDTDEVNSVKGRSVDLVFELYNRGADNSGTAGWVDFARVYVTGGSGADYLDPNEPNNQMSEATAFSCGQTITNPVIGDALGGYDVDWYALSNVPVGQIDVDIDAATNIPPSDLDAVAYLVNNSGSTVAWNDDDGVSYDSYITYTNQIASAGYFVVVESYRGDGSPNYTYKMTVQCGGAGNGPPDGGTGVTEPVTDTWTIMLYLNAEDAGFESILLGYINSIEAYIGSKSSFLKVAVLYDGPAGSTNSEFGSGTTRLLLQPGSYTNGVSRWNMGELNMGNPDTLADFVTWAMDQYPAENYYLAIDDHGNGVYGLSFDATSQNDQLTPPELYSALKFATNDGARKIDIFDYEACLMGLAENAYDLRQWVDYVVFFEQISWGINTYPVYFSDLAASTTPQTVGQRIISRYHSKATAAEYPHTISLIKTSAMAAVGNAVTSFGNTIKATNTTAQKNAINTFRNNSQAFAADYDATNALRAEYIDLWDLASKANSLAPSQATALKNAVDAAVIANEYASGGSDGYVWNHNGAHGLSIYYPTSKSSSAYNNYIAERYQMSQQGSWDEFLAWALPDGDRRGMSVSRSELKLTGNGHPFIFKNVYLPLIRKS